MLLDMKIRTFPRVLAVFLASAAWILALTPWDGFGDPDAFYHAKMSALLWQQGPLHAFPWLDLTLFGQHFADLHFLYHVIVAPFTAAFGIFGGLHAANALLVAVMLTVFYLCLRRLKLPYAAFWTALLAVTYPFLFRALLGKATPLALLLYVAGLCAAWKRKPWLLAGIAFILALSYSGWLYLAGSVALLALGQASYRIVVEDEAWRHVVKTGLWPESLCAFAGALLGMLAHPNFPQDFILGWTQVFTIGLLTPFGHVVMGEEWLPTSISQLIVSYAPWLIFMLLGLSGFFLAPREPVDRDRAQLLVSLGWIFSVVLALTLKSRRNTEYLAPVTALWCAALWSHVDVGKWRSGFSASLESLGRFWRKTLPGVIGICCGVLVFKYIWVIWTNFHPPNYPYDIYRVSISAISARARPGDRVFHSSWDEFPMLFAADDRLKYVSGLDPTFLYVASTTLSDDVKNLTWDVTSSTQAQAWELIHDRLDSRFVFISRPNHKKFLDLISSDQRYTQIASSTDSAAFELH